MREVHPFGSFIPPKAKYLLLGSFATKPTEKYDWFYANGRNQFWPIMEAVYGLKLDNRDKQQALFVRLEMALADIILTCKRRGNSNLDSNLYDITYNRRAINLILKQHRIEKIFFSSRFAEELFRKHFYKIINRYPLIGLITLPSPSPRYAAMSRAEKVRRYKLLLPKYPGKSAGRNLPAADEQHKGE